MSNVLRVESAVQEFTALSDRELVDEVARRAARERHATGDFLRVLIEFDARRLYLGEGYSSLFAYCTQALHYSEHAAFNRIEVARAAARWPQLLTCIEDGSLHLAGARLLAPHLTEENIEQTLAEARHRSKREIEEVAARLAQRAILVAVDAEEYRLYLTISRQTRDTLRQVQALIRHQAINANVAVIFEQALSLLLEKLQRQRFAATGQPEATDQPAPPEATTEVAAPRPPVSGGSGGRRVSAAVHRAVWQRDQGQCAFVGHQGRCSERTLLEFHHVIPYAAGGAGTAENIELRCRAHNRYEAELYFGEAAVRPRRVRVKAAQVAKVDSSAQAGGDGTRPGASPAADVEPSTVQPASSSRTRSS